MHDPRLTVHDSVPDIEPFWARLPRFFLFPLETENLLVLGAFSLASLLGHVAPLPFPLDFAVVLGLILLAAMRHAFSAMDATSRGRLTAARQQAALPNRERVNLPWKYLGVMIVWGFIGGLVEAMSRTLGAIVGVFTLLTLPAMIMALSVTNSFFAALNPLLWMSIVRNVGKPYLALLLFLTLLSGGTLAALPVLGPLLGGWLTLPLLTFAFLYFNLIMFNMMGYVLYQYHRELGVIVDPPSFRGQDAGAPVRAEDRVAAEVARHVAEGDLDAAIEAAYEQQRTEPENIVAQARYHKLLLMADKKDRALGHGRRYLATLLRLGRGPEAVDLLKTLREIDPELRPEHPGDILKMAEAAERRREPALALSVMRAFDRQHPRHPDVPAIYFLSARILSEHYRKDDMAGAILRGLCEKFPDHPLRAEAGAYLDALDAITRQAMAKGA